MTHEFHARQTERLYSPALAAVVFRVSFFEGSHGDRKIHHRDYRDSTGLEIGSSEDATHAVDAIPIDMAIAMGLVVPPTPKIIDQDENEFEVVDASGEPLDPRVFVVEERETDEHGQDQIVHFVAGSNPRQAFTLPAGHGLIPIDVSLPHNPNLTLPVGGF